MTKVDWIKVNERPLTAEEKEEFNKSEYGEYIVSIIDGDVPEDEQEVLVTNAWGGIDITTFYKDENGAWFDNYEAGEVLAWAEKPERYIPD